MKVLITDDSGAVLFESSAPHSEPLKAYDLAPLTADQVKADGVTWNADGSLWLMEPARNADGSLSDQKVAAAECFGYISPIKTPTIWEWARANLTPEGFARWDAAWHANPYAIYRADPRELIAKGTLNLMSFDYLLQPVRTLVQ